MPKLPSPSVCAPPFVPFSHPSVRLSLARERAPFIGSHEIPVLLWFAACSCRVAPWSSRVRRAEKGSACSRVARVPARVRARARRELLLRPAACLLSLVLHRNDCSLSLLSLSWIRPASSALQHTRPLPDTRGRSHFLPLPPTLTLSSPYSLPPAIPCTMPSQIVSSLLAALHETTFSYSVDSALLGAAPVADPVASLYPASIRAGLLADGAAAADAFASNGGSTWASHVVPSVNLFLALLVFLFLVEERYVQLPSLACQVRASRRASKRAAREGGRPSAGWPGDSTDVLLCLSATGARQRLSAGSTTSLLAATLSRPGFRRTARQPTLAPAGWAAGSGSHWLPRRAASWARCSFCATSLFALIRACLADILTSLVAQTRSLTTLRRRPSGSARRRTKPARCSTSQPASRPSRSSSSSSA